MKQCNRRSFFPWMGQSVRYTFDYLIEQQSCTQCEYIRSRLCEVSVKRLKNIVFGTACKHPSFHSFPTPLFSPAKCWLPLILRIIDRMQNLRQFPQFLHRHRIVSSSFMESTSAVMQYMKVVQNYIATPVRTQIFDYLTQHLARNVSFRSSSVLEPALFQIYCPNWSTANYLQRTSQWRRLLQSCCLFVCSVSRYMHWHRPIGYSCMPGPLESKSAHSARFSKIPSILKVTRLLSFYDGTQSE